MTTKMQYRVACKSKSTGAVSYGDWMHSKAVATAWVMEMNKKYRDSLVHWVDSSAQEVSWDKEPDGVAAFDKMPDREKHRHGLC